jgi:type II secretory pathway component PulM
MFATMHKAIDQGLERRREARRCELQSLSAQEARIKQRVTEIVREADDEGDWRAAGCSTSSPSSQTILGARSPPTSHTHHPTEQPS